MVANPGLARLYRQRENILARGTDYQRLKILPSVERNISAMELRIANPTPYQAKYHYSLQETVAAALPHRDASNQELGPNLGGTDAVTTQAEASAQAASAARQTAAVGGAGLVVVALIVFVLIAGGQK